MLRLYNAPILNMIIKMKKILTSLVSVIIATSIQAQIPGDFIRIDANSIDGLEITQERTFTKKSLFGYMNGGAELYLEYGFDRLVVTELEIDGKEIKVEAYRMPSADMAFGIYSVNIFRCNQADALSRYYCQSDYQVQFHKGNYYVNIINSSGSSDGLDSARKIAGQMLALIKDNPFDLDDYIPEEFYPKMIEKLLLISGDVAMGNYAFEYSHYIEAYTNYKLLIVDSGSELMLIFRFDNGEQIEKFRNSMGIDQFPECGKKIRLNDVDLSLTDKGDIIIHIDED